VVEIPLYDLPPDHIKLIFRLIVIQVYCSDCETIYLNVMKRLSFYSGFLFLTFGSCLISLNSYSQEVKLSAKERKEARKAEIYANYQSLDTLLERMTFVVEADYLQDQYGKLTPVTSQLNFIKIDIPRVVLQTGSLSSSDYNGFGGLTAEGILNTWKITKDPKHLNYCIKFGLCTDVGNYDVDIQIEANNSARAKVTSLQRGILVYRGIIVSSYNSGVYKSQNTILSKYR